MAESRLPKVHIPMAVDTRGIDSGLSAAEQKVRASAKRMAAIEARSGGGLTGERLALGRKTLGMALQRSGVGGGIGEMAGMALAGGGVGLAAAGLSAGFLAFDVASRALKDAVTGASDALKRFHETGEQTFAANARVLAGLAKIEEETKGLTITQTIAQAFQFGRSEVGATGKEGSVSQLVDQATGLAAVGATGLGSLFQGGSFREGLASGAGAFGKLLGLDQASSAVLEGFIRTSARTDTKEEAAVSQEPGAKPAAEVRSEPKPPLEEQFQPPQEVRPEAKLSLEEQFTPPQKPQPAEQQADVAAATAPGLNTALATMLLEGISRAISEGFSRTARDPSSEQQLALDAKRRAI